MKKIVIDAATFAEGKQYRVIKEGAVLARQVTMALIFSRQQKRPLAIGEVVTYLGSARCTARLAIEVDWFATGDGFESEFTPAIWGLLIRKRLNPSCKNDSESTLPARR